jgi:hypothetical protein
MHSARAVHLFPIWLVLSVCVVSPRAAGPAPAADEWTPLLDKGLSHWETYLSFRHKNGYSGKAPTDEKGEPIPPIGYNKDAAGVFTVVEENGAPVLRVSGEIYGAVFTRQEFENYHLRLKVKWGTRKWEPRADLLKDSGLLYHSVGESGVDYWRSWMLSQEFQIMQGHMGDFWPQANSAIDIRAFPREGNMSPVASEKQPFLPFGGGSPNGGFCMRSADYESPNGEWTEIELIAVGDKSLHIVNGKVVMVLRNSRYMANGKAIPLTKGRLQIQSEAAEVFYKEIAIRKLSGMPKEYATYFE